MDDGLKQRLVGAVVLIAIGVLFLPTLFGTEGRRTVDLNSQVPPKPVVVAEPLELAVPQPPENARGAKPLAENYDHNTVVTSNSSDTQTSDQSNTDTNKNNRPSESQIQQNNAEAEQAIQQAIAQAPEASQQSIKPVPTFPEPVLDADGVPRGWSIQVASFSEVTRAEVMLKNLAKIGYSKSYIRSGKGPKGEVYRVFVGPKINKQQAESDQQAIDKALKVKSLLVKFQP